MENQIAFISDQSGQFDVYVIPAEGGEARLVLDAGYPAWKVRWSPDGFWLAVTVEAGGIDFGTYIVTARGGWGSASGLPMKAGRSMPGRPAGRRMARGWLLPRTCTATTISASLSWHTHHIHWLTDGEGEKQFPAWSPDGRRLAYVFNRSTISWLVDARSQASLRGCTRLSRVFITCPTSHRMATISSSLSIIRAIRRTYGRFRWRMGTSRS